MLQFKGQAPASLELIITGNLMSWYSSAHKLNISPAEISEGLCDLARDSPVMQWRAACSPCHSAAVPVCATAPSKTGDRQGFGRYLVFAPIVWRNRHPLRTSSGQNKCKKQVIGALRCNRVENSCLPFPLTTSSTFFFFLPCCNSWPDDN